MRPASALSGWKPKSPGREARVRVAPSREKVSKRKPADFGISNLVELLLPATAAGRPERRFAEKAREAW